MVYCRDEITENRGAVRDVPVTSGQVTASLDARGVDFGPDPINLQRLTGQIQVARVVSHHLQGAPEAAGFPPPFLPWADAIGEMAMATTMATSTVLKRFMCPPFRRRSSP